ncbi:MAG: A24 family peptidase [Pirellulaceae bacterium]|nr:A24 family peptidase [Pirellulaceae bacterium]
MSCAFDWGTAVADHWPVWLLTLVLIVAAVIDAIRLRVPNWLTFPLVAGGWAYSAAMFGWEGLGGSLLGTAVGFGLLFPAHVIGGMGAGDVKLFAGVGAWLHATQTLHAFCVSAIVGGLFAVLVVAWCGQWRKHWLQFQMIFFEIVTIRDPQALSAIAAERKSTMKLLPYGISIMLGTIVYLGWSGQLIWAR